ncbi:MAG: glycosyltransferase [Oscillospiraceae bacterium]|nr:glycosyltransferase [Oscillospiraceae bacterium]
MEQDILISVIVPVYNVEAYLPRCVDSILAQTYSNLEIILVDDGTRDASDKICDDYARKDSRVRVIHKENGGLSSARNAGIDTAKGEYLAFVDSDDWIEPETYETMLGLARQYGVKLVCGGRYDVSSETGQREVGLCPPRQEVVDGEEVVRRIFLWENIDSASWDKLYHRSLFREIRFPLGKICEDIPIMYRIVLDAGRVAMCDKPFYNYYHRPGSITTASVSEKTFHFAEHTAVIYPYICLNHPHLKNEARYFRIRSLVHTMLCVDLAGKAARKEFAGQYREAARELRASLPFLLTSPFFGQKERLTDLTLALGAYRLLRRIYHGLK